MPGNKKIETRTAIFYLDAEGILHITIKPDIEIDMDDAVDNYIVSRRVSLNQPRLKLVDGSVNWKITDQARNYMLRDDVPERTIARAVVVKNSFNKLLVNFLLQLSKPNSPLKIFTSVDQGMEWLHSFKK